MVEELPPSFPTTPDWEAKQIFESMASINTFLNSDFIDLKSFGHDLHLRTYSGF